MFVVGGWVGRKGGGWGILEMKSEEVVVLEDKGFWTFC